MTRRKSLRCCAAACAWLCGLLLMALSPACASHPAEETVTVDADRLSAFPAKSPIAVTPQLPARDADIESAGDHIAEAITGLSKRRGGGTARGVALRALEQAEAALSRALRDKSYPDGVRDDLRSILKDLNLAERTIQRGAYADAIKDLNVLDKRLDNLNLNSNS